MKEKVVKRAAQRSDAIPLPQIVSAAIKSRRLWKSRRDFFPTNFNKERTGADNDHRLILNSLCNCETKSF